MATATVHIESVGGFAGPARCFRIDPPIDGHEYVTAWAQAGFANVVGPEVCLVPATETGASAEISLKRRPGSYVLHDEPDTTERIDGAYALALLMLGGYQIVDPAPVDAPEAAA